MLCGQPAVQMELHLKNRQIKRERDRQECDTAVRCVSVDAVHHLMHTVLNLLCEWCLFPKAREYSNHFQLF